MSINSADNHWMYISSTGCLTAGREQAKYALFPYVTDDLLHQNARYTGPSTHILVEQNNKKYLWQPFSDQIESYKKEQNLYKNSLGNKIVFDNNQLIVPNNPVIPFIEGDGIGPDIWYASKMAVSYTHLTLPTIYSV